MTRHPYVENNCPTGYHFRKLAGDWGLTFKGDIRTAKPEALEALQAEIKKKISPEAIAQIQDEALAIVDAELERRQAADSERIDAQQRAAELVAQQLSSMAGDVGLPEDAGVEAIRAAVPGVVREHIDAATSHGHNFHAAKTELRERARRTDADLPRVARALGLDGDGADTGELRRGIRRAIEGQLAELGDDRESQAIREGLLTLRSGIFGGRPSEVSIGLGESVRRIYERNHREVRAFG